MNPITYNAGRISAQWGYPSSSCPLWLSQADQVCWLDGWRDVARPAVAALEPEVVAAKARRTA